MPSSRLDFINRYIVVLIPLLLTTSCSHQRHSLNPYEYSYKAENPALKVEYKIYHINAHTSRLYYSIDNTQVLYQRMASASTYKSSLRISYRIHSNLSAERKSYLDTGSVYIADSRKELKAEKIEGYLNVTLTKGPAKRLEITLRDYNKKKEVHEQMMLQKDSLPHEQDYLFKRADSSVIFKRNVTLGSPIYMECSRFKLPKLIISYLPSSGQFPLPPFSETSLSTKKIKDSVFTINAIHENQYQFTPQQAGAYLIGSGKNKLPVSIHVSKGAGIDKIYSHQQMIYSTRYILKQEEYEQILGEGDLKMAIDNFWKQVAGDEGRAALLIKHYYSRVEQCNLLFTNLEEGWKTDRGMIYIVFGVPTKVYRSGKNETWVFGKEGTPDYIVFNFIKQGLHTTEEYVLQRNTSLKESWFKAVNTWREGKVLSYP